MPIKSNRGKLSTTNRDVVVGTGQFARYILHLRSSPLLVLVVVGDNSELIIDYK